MSVRGSGFCTSFTGYTREVRGGKVAVGTCAAFEELFHEAGGGFALVWLESSVLTWERIARSNFFRCSETENLLTGEGGIVLDTIVHVHVTEVKCVRRIVAQQDLGDVVWHKVAETGREVVRVAYFPVQLFERDVASVMWQDA